MLKNIRSDSLHFDIKITIIGYELASQIDFEIWPTQFTPAISKTQLNSEIAKVEIKFWSRFYWAILNILTSKNAQNF